MTSDGADKLLKWEVHQRLTLLEATVFWTGELVTGFLTSTFNISRIQATKDIGLYLALRPDNLRYDRSRKRYLITEQFKPLLISGSAQECLQVLQTTQSVSPSVVTLISNLPTVEVIAPPARLLDIDVLRPVLQAARFGLALEIVYQSMTTPVPKALIILPQALVFDGLRWHVRAFSQTHDQFRDFVLARIHSVKALGKLDRPCPVDELWNKWVTVAIGPHPSLSLTQQQVIERDFGMAAGRLCTQVRAALVPYFLLGMRIGRDDVKRDALTQQIVLLNREEIVAYVDFG